MKQEVGHNVIGHQHPGRSGLEVLEEVKRQCPRTPGAGIERISGDIRVASLKLGASVSEQALARMSAGGRGKGAVPGSARSS